jgi:hypothetical protein
MRDDDQPLAEPKATLISGSMTIWERRRDGCREFAARG